VSNSHEFNAEDPINQGSASAFAEQTSSSFVFTWLRDQFAQRKRLIRLSSTEKFARCLRATTAPSKAALPWAKLAELGQEPSPAGSYRYDANVIALWGAEGDYDGDNVPIEKAASLIQAAGIEAVLNETTTPGHWRVWLPASRRYRGSTDELRTLRGARWVARANGVLGGILAPESFVLSQAFYLGGIEGQSTIQVITTVGARIDLCDDLDDGAIYKNGTSNPSERRQPVATPDAMTPSDDDPRLIRECRLRVAGFEQRWGCGTTPSGERAHKLVMWLADSGTRDGLTPSAAMIRAMIRDAYPQTTRAMIEAMLARRKEPRGWDVIDPEPELPWGAVAEDEETVDDD
jgi:hypothetical protein